MINLIPPKAKKDLILGYWVRAVSVWLILWSVAIIFGSSLLIPVYVLINSQIIAFGDNAAEVSAKVSNYETLAKDLRQSSEQARLVIRESDLSTFSELVDLFESLEGNDTVLNKITSKREKEKITSATLIGVATDRQALASFRDRLLAEENITEVDLPISNLARDKDIAFTIIVKFSDTTI